MYHRKSGTIKSLLQYDDVCTVYVATYTLLLILCKCWPAHIIYRTPKKTRTKVYSNAKEKGKKQKAPCLNQSMSAGGGLVAALR